LEDYHNLLYKNVMGLQWGVQFCPQAQMLIKIDDDTAINLTGLLAIAPPLIKNGGLLGRVIDQGKPQRNSSKWMVTHKEWPLPRYPHYLLGYLPHSLIKIISAN
jgi:hypothetical protein